MTKPTADLTQTNTRLQDILNRLVRIESRLTRFGEEMGVDMRLQFPRSSRDPREDPIVVHVPDLQSDDLRGVMGELLSRAVHIETQLCSTMNLMGVSPQHSRREPREMAALRHHRRVAGH